MLLTGKVGAQLNLANGTVNPVRQHRDGALIVLPQSAGLVDAAINGRLFCGATQASVTTSTTLNTTFTGLGLCNPAGSGKLILVHEFGYAAKAAVTGETVLALATTTDTGFAADIAPRCCRNGFAQSVAILDKAATITAPVIERIIGQLGQGSDTTLYGGIPPTNIKLDGSIVLAPGRAVVTDTTVASGDVMLFSFLWEEIEL